MMRRLATTVLLAAVVMALTAGCAVRLPAPRNASAGPGAANAAWERILSRNVDDRGRIDFSGLAKDRSDLDAFVAYVGEVSPRSSPGEFPTREAVLAYYLNAYNALAMYNVLESGVPPELDSIKVRFFYKNRLRMGGRWISLYALENRLVRPLGEPRVHFALNCMVRGCPRLPREPFAPERLEAQLEAAARLFFSEPRNVELRPGERLVRFNEILRFYTKDFLAESPSLIAYANRYRADPIPADWKTEFIPYDWTLNQQGLTPAGGLTPASPRRSP